ncbi:MAG TPA: hypothetical protein VEK57_08420 [Thermoanaerobaculia bacterium]|nr:hypothetical protein [Thermoanaerobaculia bacterium]
MVPEGTPYIERQIDEVVRFAGIRPGHRVLEVDFGAAKDLVPALPLIAYWSARAVTALANRLGRRTAGAVLSLYFVLLFIDAAVYRPGYTLAAQLRDVETLLGPSRARFIAFGAEDFYVLTETRAPIRYLRLGTWVDSFIDARDPGGVAAFPSRVAALRPAAIIIRDVGGPSRARTALETHLRHHTRTMIRTPYTYPIANLYRHVRPQWPATVVYRLTDSIPVTQ